jgi:hypothetical protein
VEQFGQVVGKVPAKRTDPGDRLRTSAGSEGLGYDDSSGGTEANAA